MLIQKEKHLSDLQRVWQELQAIPSYVERCKLAKEQEQINDNRMFRGEKCDSCGYTYCTCNE